MEKNVGGRPPGRTPKTMLNIGVPPELAEQLKDRAKAEKTTVTAIMVRLVSRYLKRAR